MTFSLFISLLKLIASLVTYFQSRGWITEGEQRERARAMAEVLNSINVATKTSSEVKVLTNEEIDQLITNRGWYRE